MSGDEEKPIEPDKKTFFDNGMEFIRIEPEPFPGYTFDMGADMFREFVEFTRTFDQNEFVPVKNWIEEMHNFFMLQMVSLMEHQKNDANKTVSIVVKAEREELRRLINQRMIVLHTMKSLIEYGNYSGAVLLGVKTSELFLPTLSTEEDNGLEFGNLKMFQPLARSAMVQKISGTKSRGNNKSNNQIAARNFVKENLVTGMTWGDAIRAACVKFGDPDKPLGTTTMKEWCKGLNPSPRPGPRKG